MKHWITLTAALAFAICLPASATTMSFNSDNEGFEEIRIVRDPVDPPSTEVNGVPTSADWQATGGVGDTGYIRQWVNNNRNNRAFSMYFDQTPNLLGDLTGQTLSAAFKQWGAEPFLALFGPDVRLRWTLAKYDAVTETETRYFSKESESIAFNDPIYQNWTNRSIDMVESNFLLWPNDQMAPLLSFDNLLQDYDSIGFFLTSATDDLDQYDTSVNGYLLQGLTQRLHNLGANADCEDGFWGVDNLGVVVPEPATMTLLGIGIAGLAYRRIRNRKEAVA